MSYLRIDTPVFRRATGSRPTVLSLTQSQGAAQGDRARDLLEGVFLIGFFVTVAAGGLYLRAALGFMH